MAELYITEEQREKCRKVADGFLEIYENADVMVGGGGGVGFFPLAWF